MPKTLKLIKCPHCNAPINYVLGETLFTCQYCGYTFSMIKEGEYKEIAQGKHFVVINNYSRTEMEEALRDWMRKGVLKAGDLAEKSKLIEMELKFVPIWLVNVSAETTFRGKKKIESVETRTLNKGRKETTRRVRWEDKSGEFSDVIEWKVLASRGMRLPLDKIELSVANKAPFDIKNVSPGAKLINGDVHEELARQQAESGIQNYHRDKASREVDQILEIESDVQSKDAQLLTIPLWFMRYKYKNKLYSIIAEGSSGKIVQGEAPMGKYDIALIAGIIIIIVVAIIIGVLFWPR
ncbi:hypothetical protein KAT21_01255 [Candidatus Bathyarchaeota archaeon]|nr:hypothetical protein [Candidatus Bathyarchaeota archaeon]